MIGKVNAPILSGCEIGLTVFDSSSISVRIVLLHQQYLQNNLLEQNPAGPPFIGQC